MNYESEVSREGLSQAAVETGTFNIITTGKEKTSYSDILSAGREIGRQKFWGWTKLLVGGGGFIIADMAHAIWIGQVLFKSISLDQIDLPRLAVLTGLTVGAWYTAKDGLTDLGIANSRDAAIKDVPFGASLNLETEQSEEKIQSPALTN